MKIALHIIAIGNLTRASAALAEIDLSDQDERVSATWKRLKAIGRLRLGHIGIDHFPSRAEMFAGQGPARRIALLLVHYCMGVIASARFLRIARVQRALVLAGGTVEERAQRRGNDPSK